MKRIDRRRMDVNRRKWDESVALHVRSPDYDLPSFLRGRSTLRTVELEEVGPVRGRSLLHLQCHFGLDTLSWARRGARVTGVDYSHDAVTQARHLAQRIGVDARFVESNVFDLRRRLRGQFDIVYTGRGALCWLPELSAWGRLVAHYLKPGGTFYLMEGHPFADVFPNEIGTRSLRPGIDYFRRTPQRWELAGTYAARKAKMRHKVSYDWVHPVSEVLGALLDAGLAIEFVHEFPFTFWKQFPFMHRGRDGWWRLDRQDQLVPLMWTVRARRTA